MQGGYVMRSVVTAAFGRGTAFGRRIITRFMLVRRWVVSGRLETPARLASESGVRVLRGVVSFVSREGGLGTSRPS